MKALILVLSAVFSVPAFATDKFILDDYKLRGALVNLLKDPDSAVFRNIRTKRAGGENDTYAICGDVNAKNELGGYTGYVPFMVGRIKPKGKPEEYIAIGVGIHISMTCAREGL